MEQFLGMWLALCLVGAYLGLVALFCGGCIRLMRCPSLPVLLDTG
jgi:hypothetical protein